MQQENRRAGLRRRLVLLGSTGVLVAAGAGGIAALSHGTVVHATGVSTQVKAPEPAETTTGPDTDTLQQGDQSGAQNTTGPDTATAATTAVESASGETSGTEADGPGGHEDAAGSAGQDGNFDN